MDTELAERLMELTTGMARVDERTIAILDHQKSQNEAFVAHQKQDHEDFQVVHSRISGVEDDVIGVAKKQNWILGIGTACAFVITLIFGVAFGG